MKYGLFMARIACLSLFLALYSWSYFQFWVYCSCPSYISNSSSLSLCLPQSNQPNLHRIFISNSSSLSLCLPSTNQPADILRLEYFFLNYITHLLLLTIFIYSIDEQFVVQNERLKLVYSNFFFLPYNKLKG